MTSDHNPDYEFSITEQLDLVDTLIDRYQHDRVGLLMFDALRASLEALRDTLIARSYQQRDEAERIHAIEQRFLSEMRAANEQLVALSEQIGVTL